MKLGGYWSNAEIASFGGELSLTVNLLIYSLFVTAEVVGFIIGGVMLDSMMADIVEDSEVKPVAAQRVYFMQQEVLQENSLVPLA